MSSNNNYYSADYRTISDLTPINDRYQDPKTGAKPSYLVQADQPEGERFENPLFNLKSDLKSNNSEAFLYWGESNNRNYYHSNHINNTATNLNPTTPTSISSQCEHFPKLYNSLDFTNPWLLNNPMNHRHSISISSEQSAIETSDKGFNAAGNNTARKVSFTESDQNVSPVLSSDPFELDQSLWSVPSLSTPNASSAFAGADHQMKSPNYGYNVLPPGVGTDNTSPTFASKSSRNPSVLLSDFNLGGNLQQQTPQQPDFRRNSYFSNNIWTQDSSNVRNHSRQSSFNAANKPGLISTSPQYTDVSPSWAGFGNNGNPGADWKFAQPNSVQKQQQPVQPQYKQPIFNSANAAAAEDFISNYQRRFSYATSNERQWQQPELAAGFDPIQGPGFLNYQQQQQQQPQPSQLPSPQQQQRASIGHAQRLSADFGNLGLRGNDTAHELSKLGELGESSLLFRSSYKSVDYYFSNDRHQRVHITDARTNNIASLLEELAKKGAQLPRFPGNLFPGANLVLVGFKAGRLDVFYLPENSGMKLTIGDLVVVEADRGQDLGKVLRLDVSIDEARLLKLRQHQEQQLALVDNEQLISSGVLPPINGQQAQGQQAQQAAQQQPVPALHFPKPVIRFADPAQVAQIPSKNTDEEKACRVCALKVKAKGLVMHVVDLEYQWDRRKLTFYYAANQRIDFRELVKELFRIYKTRIWMCAVSGGMELVLEHELKIQNEPQEESENEGVVERHNDTSEFNWSNLEHFR